MCDGATEEALMTLTLLVGDNKELLGDVNELLIFEESDFRLELSP